MNQSNDILLLNAFADGELDPVATLTLEQRLSREPELAAQLNAITALGRTLRLEVPVKRATLKFRAEMAALASPPQPRRVPWRQMAMAACLGGLVASAATFLSIQPNRGDEATATLLAAHMRGLASPQPLDIASNDRHNVKPWFDGRLAFAPVVVDVSPEGFPLAGGRMDAVGGQLAATMVYRSQQHVITVTEARTAALPTPVRATAASRDGYIIQIFTTGDLTCWIITDLPAAQADSFAAAWRAGAARL